MAERVGVLVKFPRDLLDRVEMLAIKTDQNRMATILELVERGLEAPAASKADVRSPTFVPRKDTGAGWGFNPKGKK